MDGWGLLIFGISIVLYLLTKSKTFIFSAGVGAGIFIGALWAALIVASVFG